MAENSLKKARTKIEAELIRLISGSGRSCYSIAKMSGLEQSIISRFVVRKRSLSVPSFVNLAHGLGHSFERQMAEISAIASVRESDEHSCQPLSRQHPLAGMHAIETAIVNAVAASRDALASFGRWSA